MVSPVRSEHQAARSIDAIIEASRAPERRLAAVGEPLAHELMFALREVLLDLRRLSLVASRAATAEHAPAAKEALREFAATFLHEVVPHARFHLEEVEDVLDPDGTEDGRE